jgi:hypothetical protein
MRLAIFNNLCEKDEEISILEGEGEGGALLIPCLPSVSSSCHFFSRLACSYLYYLHFNRRSGHHTSLFFISPRHLQQFLRGGDVDYPARPAFPSLFFVPSSSDLID